MTVKHYALMSQSHAMRYITSAHSAQYRCPCFPENMIDYASHASQGGPLAGQDNLTLMHTLRDYRILNRHEQM